ncbi:hypothetical protein [Rhodococcoides yunnanense]|jgi:uncharacterized protein YukE|uniref:hypothetical protein n=1 Tax=Rhodococcoides yunnanense TaxID=278209 RepID=UPI0022B0A9C0|nr:hypothetical protein [Rhodococcus yunnanensis]MCZ4277349.1 hypothetical protein [Rhodococcus yunnanensis]
MSIDTSVEGNPESVRASARWLRESFAATIEQATDAIYSTRNNVDAAWDGPASQAAVGKLSNGAERADEMAQAAREFARAVDDFAAGLQQTQNDMADVRADASAAGLTLIGNTIEDPWSQSEVLASAYSAIQHGVAATLQTQVLVGETLKNAWATIREKWFFVLADLLNGVGKALALKHSSLMTGHAAFLTARYLDLAQSAPPGTPASQIYRDFDWARTTAQNAEDLLDTAKNAEANAGRIAGRLNGGLAVAGIASDIYNGKPVDQAIVSGGLGFGAAVAAGAAIGTFVPVPGVGTVLGALGGAAVAIFTSGAVDTLYAEGLGSAGDAIGDGAAAVAETGTAIGQLATGAWDAIF